MLTGVLLVILSTTLTIMSWKKAVLACAIMTAKTGCLMRAYRSTQRDPRLFEGVSLAQDIRQADISAFVPLTGNFNLVGRWNHDFTNSRALDIFAGFEYNSCCWRASLVARRWLDRRDEVLRPEEDLRCQMEYFSKYNLKVWLAPAVGLTQCSTMVSTVMDLKKTCNKALIAFLLTAALNQRSRPS